MRIIIKYDRYIDTFNTAYYISSHIRDLREPLEDAVDVEYKEYKYTHYNFIIQDVDKLI